MLLNLEYTHYDIYVEFEQDIVIEMFNEMKQPACNTHNTTKWYPEEVWSVTGIKTLHSSGSWGRG